MSQFKDKNFRYETRINLLELFSLDDLKKLIRIIPELSNLFTPSQNTFSPINKSKTFCVENPENIKLSKYHKRINKFTFFKIIISKLKSFFEVNESFIIMKTLSIIIKEIENMEKYFTNSTSHSKKKIKNEQKSESKHENIYKNCIKYEKVKKQNFKNSTTNRTIISKNNGTNIPNSTFLNNVSNHYETLTNKKNRVYFKLFENQKKENKTEINSFSSKNEKNKDINLNKTERKISEINLALSKLKKFKIQKKFLKTKTSSELGVKIYIDSNDSSTHSHNFSTNFDSINLNNNLREYNTINNINNIHKNKVIHFSKQVKNSDNKNQSDLFNNNNNLYINIYEQKKINNNSTRELKTNEENNNISEKDNLNINYNNILMNTSLLNNIETEDFDIFELDKKLNKKTLVIIGNYIFNRFGFNNIIKYSMFENWCTKISEGYNRKNPYHTDLHAGDITQSCLVYFKCGKINEICKLNQLSKCALFLSCICHDYKHPGVNNNFLRETKNILAIKYNDCSILENMHISESFKLTLDQPNCDIFSGMNSENYKQLRKEMISCVLYTDMVKHNMTIDFMKEVNDNKNKEKDYHQDYLNLLIHSADISNPTKKFNLYNKWAKLVVEEFFQQGDKEKELGIKCSFDRETTTIYQSQLGFIDYIEIPFFTLYVKTFPKLKFLMDNLNNNKNEILALQEKDKNKNKEIEKKTENNKKVKK